MIDTNTFITPLLVFLDSNNVCVSFYSNFNHLLAPIPKERNGEESVYCGIPQPTTGSPLSAGISTVRREMGEFICEVTQEDSEYYYLTKTPDEENYKVIKFINSTPVNNPQHGHYFDEEKNAFIPPCPVEGYILDESSFEWKPDPTVEYNLHGDGKLYKYDPENLWWNLVE